MQFATCAHGNIQLTCPQCKGRAPAVGAAPVSAFGLPTTPASAAARGVAQAVPPDDSIEGLWDRLKNPDAKFNVLVGSQLEKLVERSEAKVEASSDREARQHRAFWSQVSAPTTVAEHERLRQEQGQTKA